MVKKLRTFIAYSLLPFHLWAQQQIHIASPDAQIKFTLTTAAGVPQYSVSFKNRLLISGSALNVKTMETGTFANVRFAKAAVFKSVKEKYSLIVGKANLVENQYKQAVIYLADAVNKNHKVNIEVRVFNDGVAFRYHFPSTTNQSVITLLEEQTQFRFTEDPVTKALLLPNFTTSHEGLYTTSALTKIQEDTLMDVPALFQLSGNTFVAITEAALLDYAGMYLSKHNGILQSSLSPLPGQEAIKVKALLPHHSPWRVLMISDRVGAFIESNISSSLNETPEIKEWSWLKPGTTTFPWWNGTIIPDSIKGGNNFETNKYYIDFCAANNITYHSIVEYGGHEWYTNDGEGYQPGKNVDITKPVDGLDIKAICDYGKQKGVGIRVWTHWKALYPKLDTAFALFEQWGLSGMMVDFMDRDDQEMVNIQTEILEKAAKHKLHIQFHGAYKPTGLHRTYPNELTREGAMNYEYHKWDKIITPDADLNIVFTRMLAGPTDYHQGGFRALPQDEFVVQNFKPYVMGTRCHMLAMYVVLENYLPMVADYPDAYIGQPGFEVIQKIPGTWHQTVVPSAQVDEYVSIARRCGSDWYIGTITNHQKRSVTLSFNFLDEGIYTATIYSDAADADVNPNHLTKESKQVNKKTKLEISLAGNGGSFIHLRKN
jgi:alpha-glucosidase